MAEEGHVARDPMPEDNRKPADRMDRRSFVKSAVIGAAGAGALTACGAGGSSVAGGEAVATGPEVTWRLASSFPRSLDIIFGAAESFAQRVSDLTGGRFRIRVYPAGELVPGLQVMDAVQQGTVHAGHTASYYYTGKNPALAFATGVPFGFTARQQNAWLYYGGGLEEMRRIMADFGIIHFPAGNTGVQMGGWFRQPISSLADLRGLRMRIPGLGGQVMSRLGVSVQVLASSEIYLALDRGAIDATEWIGPYDDERLGFHGITKHYYYPGWHEPGMTADLMINRRAWDQLPESYQRIVELCARAMNDEILVHYDAANPLALQRLIHEHGVQIRPFSQDIMQAAWRESMTMLEEHAAADATFRRVYEHWKAFRARAFNYDGSIEQSYANFAFAQALT